MALAVLGWTKIGIFVAYCIKNHISDLISTFIADGKIVNSGAESGINNHVSAHEFYVLGTNNQT